MKYNKLKTIKQVISFIAGMVITASLLQLIFITNAVRINYYSGINPLSTLLEIPVYITIELITGAIILIIYRALKIDIIRTPSEFFLFGTVLGMGSLGKLFNIAGFRDITVIIIFLLIVFLASVMAVGEEENTK